MRDEEGLTAYVNTRPKGWSAIVTRPPPPSFFMVFALIFHVLEDACGEKRHDNHETA